eukprot:3494597-Alexandrium_andersonii.AAC.1
MLCFTARATPLGAPVEASWSVALRCRAVVRRQPPLLLLIRINAAQHMTPWGSHRNCLKIMVRVAVV